MLCHGTRNKNTQRKARCQRPNNIDKTLKPCLKEVQVINQIYRNIAGKNAKIFMLLKKKLQTIKQLGVGGGDLFSNNI